jgi:hypothetical protein
LLPRLPELQLAAVKHYMLLLFRLAIERHASPIRQIHAEFAVYRLSGELKSIAPRHLLPVMS